MIGTHGCHPTLLHSQWRRPPRSTLPRSTTLSRSSASKGNLGCAVVDHTRANRKQVGIATERLSAIGTHDRHTWLPPNSLALSMAATTEIYTPSKHDAQPIKRFKRQPRVRSGGPHPRKQKTGW